MEEHKEKPHENQDAHKKKGNIKVGKDSFWKLITAVLGILIIASVITGGFNFSKGQAQASNDLTQQEASDKALDFINNKLLQPEQTASISDVKDTGSLYTFTLSVGGNSFSSYVTKDGSLLFPNAIDLNEPVEAPTAPAASTVDNADMETLMDDDAVKGDKDAPVTIIEWSDFECPYCGRFYRDTYGQIVKEYIETGKVKFIYRDFPLSFHANAKKAAEAAECAGEQGKYWEMYDKLFGEGVQGGVDSFKQYASDIGLDTEEFNKCIDTAAMADEIQKDMEDGIAVGITGTPGFIINGKLLSGAQPFSAFKAIIDAELAEQ